jgi:hypothetical protein
MRIFTVRNHSCNKLLNILNQKTISLEHYPEKVGLRSQLFVNFVDEFFNAVTLFNVIDTHAVDTCTALVPTPITRPYDRYGRTVRKTETLFPVWLFQPVFASNQRLSEVLVYLHHIDKVLILRDP